MTEPGRVDGAGTNPAGPFGGRALLWIALGAFAAACLVVNPFRETAVDDDWAYALTVKRLLETGRYRLHDWAAPNLVFQVYWGAAFARVLGFSHTTLRISTLATTLLGLLGMHGLAREHGLGRGPAGLLALALLANPLVMLFSFSFMTDVPFLVGLIVSLWLYARALRRESPWGMFLASLAASCAILTRQFGVALVGGLVLASALDGQRVRRARLYLAGVLLPGAAGAWQLWTGTFSPNWAAAWRMRDQREYWSHMEPLASNLLWRPTLILQYLALFLLPLVFFAWPRLCRPAGPPPPDRKGQVRQGLVLGLIAAWIAFGLERGREVSPAFALMPLLPGSFTLLVKSGPFVRGLLTLLTSAGAVVLGALVVRRTEPGAWRRLPPGLQVTDLTTLLLLGLHLAYEDFCDEHMLVFVPFALILVGLSLGSWDRVRVPATALCLVFTALSAVWTRGLLVEDEALWQGGELALRSGAGPRRIRGSFAWMGYHGAFDDYLAETGYHIPRHGLQGYFLDYLVARAEGAEYVVDDDEPGRPPGPGVQRIAEIPYRDQRLKRRTVYVERRPGRPEAN